MKKQKGFIKILFVVIVLILIVGVYFIYSKKGDDITSLPSANHNNSSSPYPMKELTREEDLSIGMTDWKTYRNEKYWFEVRYPNNFIISKQTENSLYLAGNQSCSEKIKLTSPGYVEKGCLYYSMLIQDNKITEDGVGVVHKVVKLGGMSGEKIINQSAKLGDEYASITIQLENGNKWYVFNVINNVVDNNTARDTLDKILSTFKFTK